MKRIYKILLALIMIFSLSLLTSQIYSLLTDTKVKGPNLYKYELGNLEYSLVGSLEDNYLYPGKNIVKTPFKLENTSTITTELRIKLNFYMLAGEVYELIDITTLIEDSGYDFNEDNNWTYDDGFYYYDGVILENEAVDIFSILILDGKIVRNNYANKNIKLEIVIHAKQEKHVDWHELTFS